MFLHMSVYSQGIGGGYDAIFCLVPYSFGGGAGPKGEGLVAGGFGARRGVGRHYPRPLPNHKAGSTHPTGTFSCCNCFGRKTCYCFSASSRSGGD